MVVGRGNPGPWHSTKGQVCFILPFLFTSYLPSLKKGGTIQISSPGCCPLIGKTAPLCPWGGKRRDAIGQNAQHVVKKAVRAYLV